MVRIQQALEAIIGQEIPIVDLFRLPTIADVARYLDEQLHNLPAAHDIVLAQAEVSWSALRARIWRCGVNVPNREKRAMSEQSYRSAGTLLAQLASGETTSVALVNHYFSRMAQFNKPLNAVVQQHYALALEAAARAIVSDWRARKGRVARITLYC